MSAHQESAHTGAPLQLFWRLFLGHDTNLADALAKMNMKSNRVAYILLWFPEPTQTFILDEVNTLVDLGLDVTVFTLYGPRPPRRLAGMAQVKAPVVHLGLAAAGDLWRSRARLRRDWGAAAPPFLRKVLLRRWRSLETAGEALWAGLYQEQGDLSPRLVQRLAGVDLALVRTWIMPVLIGSRMCAWWRSKTFASHQKHPGPMIR